MIPNRLILLILLLVLPLCYPKKSHYTSTTTGTSTSTDSSDSTSSSDSSDSTSSDSTSSDSTSSSDDDDDNDTTWMYGTCILSTCFLFMVLIYVCYNCVKFCKGSSRHTLGAKGSLSQPPPTHPNEQEPYPPYGQQTAGVYDYREQRLPY